MASDDKRKPDQQDADEGLTPEEREFRRMHPETWKQMEEEKRHRQGDDHE